MAICFVIFVLRLRQKNRPFVDLKITCSGLFASPHWQDLEGALSQILRPETRPFFSLLVSTAPAYLSQQLASVYDSP